MKNSSTVAIEGIEIFKPNQLTIGLDLGDRTSRYCVLNEAGEIILEQELARTPKGFQPVFRKIPRSRIALETYSQPAQGTRENLRDSRKDHRSLTVGA